MAKTAAKRKVKAGSARPRASRAQERDFADLLDGLSSTAGSKGKRSGEKSRQAKSGTGTKNVLGRGLSALMSASAVSIEPQGSNPRQGASDREPLPASPQSVPGVAALAPEAITADSGDNFPGSGLIYLAIDRISANAAQPRQRFPEAEIDGLSLSIKESGLLQPIIVREKPGSGASRGYQIVAGERRFRAARKAGLVHIPAIVRQLSDRETLELGIIENVQRSDLNPIEEALAYQRLIADFGQTQEQVAQTVGKDRASVANSLRLLKLPSAVLEAIVEGKISAGHGRALLGLSGPAEQRRLAQRIVSEGLSVRTVERLVKKLNSQAGNACKSSREAKSQMPSLIELEERFRRALGTKVSLIADADHRGELRISFYSQAELESLIERVGA